MGIPSCCTDPMEWDINDKKRAELLAITGLTGRAADVFVHGFEQAIRDASTLAASGMIILS